MINNEVVIELSHLKKSFGDHHVLKDISLQVRKGEVISVIGSSGSGKSTFARHLSRRMASRYVDTDKCVEQMVGAIREDTARNMLIVMIRSKEETKREQTAKITGTSGATDGSEKGRTVKKKEKVRPNDQCPCGSGKKYKNCCGNVRN